MAAGNTEIADLVVPEIFNPYVQQITEEKTAIIQAGVLAKDARMDGLLAGAGLIFQTPSFKDLDNDEDNVSSDTGSDSGVKKIGTANEKAVRLSRNQTWSASDLDEALAGEDPLKAIANRVGEYWSRRLQAMFVAETQGVFADNAAAPSGTDTHAQNDMTIDISGASYVAGVTDFNADAFIDTSTTMGDSAGSLGIIMVHSIVFSRMQKNNLIDFIPDASGEVEIPFYQGKRVIVDDGMPNPAGAGAAQTASGIYHSWVFGAGAFRLGEGSAKVPTEVNRLPLANNGGGEETLTTRREYLIHPVGHAYIGDAPNGGPSNAATANNLANADSWSRVYSERKQIKIARLITREA